MGNGNQVTPEEREALLVEYQVCEQDNAANFQGFWTLAAIFFGLSSVFLAGLIYAVIANEPLFSALLCWNEPSKTLIFGVIALTVGVANVIILRKLKGWHRRIMFNQGLNLRRMREIELELGMRRVWRATAVDRWNNIPSNKRKEATCDQQKWILIGEKLKEDIDQKYYNKLDERKDEILRLIDSHFEGGKVEDRYDKYVPSSSRKYFPCILHTLMSLWGLVIIGALVAIVMSVIKLV